MSALKTPDEVGTLTRIGCIGPFESASTDQADQAEVIYLRTTGSGAASQQVYRFEAAPTYQIEVQVTERPQVITSGDQSYRLEQVWEPSVYSSTSVILFVQDPASPAPEVIYGLDVSQTVVGDAIGEYRLLDETSQPSEQMIAAAEQAGSIRTSPSTGSFTTSSTSTRPSERRETGSSPCSQRPPKGHRKCCSVATSGRLNSSSSTSTPPPQPTVDRRHRQPARPDTSSTTSQCALRRHARVNG